jgi:hypothetical protein
MRGPERRIVAASLAAGLCWGVMGCQHAPWRRESVPPDRPYVTPPASASVEMSAPRAGFSSEPASNGYSNVSSMPAAGSPATGFGSSSTESAGSDPLSGIPGLPGPRDQATPGVMGQSGQGPSPL